MQTARYWLRKGRCFRADVRALERRGRWASANRAARNNSNAKPLAWKVTLNQQPSALNIPTCHPSSTSLCSPGRPLDTATRAFMEPRFGHDFSQVRVHADSRASTSAELVHALAYTVGQNIVFGRDFYAPSTHQGRELLGHELAHTIQQRSPADGSSYSASSGVFESTAEAAGRAVANGQSVSAHFPACGVGLARQVATPTAYDDQELARSMQQTSERLKQASYPGLRGGC